MTKGFQRYCFNDSYLLWGLKVWLWVEEKTDSKNKRGWNIQPRSNIKINKDEMISKQVSFFLFCLEYLRELLKLKCINVNNNLSRPILSNFFLVNCIIISHILDDMQFLGIKKKQHLLIRLISYFLFDHFESYEEQKHFLNCK